MNDPLASNRLPLILASQSPRRRELLCEAGYDFEVIVPRKTAEEEALDAVDFEAKKMPAEMVMRLARCKAADVARRVERGLILGCDTVAECGGEILGKPRDAHHAREMLLLLRGTEHRVYSGICLWSRPDDRVLVALAKTTLRMDKITDAQLDDYLASEQWKGKAGAFGYQDRLGWIHIVEGSESNVVGLPMEQLAKMLAEFA